MKIYLQMVSYVAILGYVIDTFMVSSPGKQLGIIAFVIGVNFIIYVTSDFFKEASVALKIAKKKEKVS